MVVLYTLKEGERFHEITIQKNRRRVLVELETRGSVNGIIVNAVMFPDGKVWDKINGMRSVKHQSSRKRFQFIREALRKPSIA